MTRRLLTALVVGVLCATFTACCGTCIKDPPCCKKPEAPK
jgi:hypothetical protein